MTYREALAWLFGTQLFGIKLGLENIQRLLRALNLPGDQKFIHVAGTNGKGSVCAMIDSILRAQGYGSGLFTSPHLITFRERIRVNGEMMSEKEVADGLTSLREMVAGWDPHPTFFEITTALALQHFNNSACEFVVLETGMGGRLDATNAVTPIVCVITPIDYDHQKWLGNSLGEIAGEKAGIIKPGVPVLSAPQEIEAQLVIEKRAHGCRAPLHFIKRPAALPLSLSGAHQKQNAALALAAVRTADVAIDGAMAVRALSSVHWPARFQRWNENITIDGAHNPAAIRALVQTWKQNFGEQKAALVIAILRDKKAPEMVSILGAIANRFLVTKARSERAIPTEELAAIAHKAAPNVPVEVVPSIETAIARSEGKLTLITGSLHFAGEALAFLRGETHLAEDCLQ
ncbi:MAG: bifunctional folylpolyglutamate synthase/dihydrofolate synthase [Verrucomicrobiota bacterium]|nr:bifunctional folylpolyglutamate synthase/dihydrofolate synthase [Verrucomicrobiota bacterium]